MTTEILVNGPINAVRMEGEIFGIKKVIYIFFDIHKSVQFQTQCPSYMSDDFNRYFAKTIGNIKLDKVYDLFFEIGEKFETINIGKFRQRYIDELLKYFKDTIEVSIVKNKKKIGSKQKNLRLHYINIRDYLKDTLNKDLDDMYYILDNAICKKYITKFSLGELSDIVISIEKTIKNLIEIFQNPKKKDDKISYYINKMMSKYKHTELKEKLIKPVLDEIYNHFNILIEKIEQIHLFINEFKNKIQTDDVLVGTDYGDYMYGLSSIFYIENLSKLYKLYNDIELYSLDGYSLIMDLFFLRRFLDKDYITNGIVYTGGAHSVFYVYLLLKYFDFKLTNSSYMEKSIHKIEDLEKLIKKEENYKKIAKYLFPNILSQCIDLTHFPPNFE